jgi:hypothetical protein
VTGNADSVPLMAAESLASLQLPSIILKGEQDGVSQEGK